MGSKTANRVPRRIGCVETLQLQRKSE
jgi:hypothetical protein